MLLHYELQCKKTLNIASNLKPTSSDQRFINTGIPGAGEPVQTNVSFVLDFSPPCSCCYFELTDSGQSL